MPDRSTYRYEEDGRLIEEAKYNPNRELAIALGERLDDVLAELDYKIGEHKELYADLEREANKLDDKVYELRVEIDGLEMALQRRDDEIAHLRDQLNKLKKEDC